MKDSENIREFGSDEEYDDEYDFKDHMDLYWDDWYGDDENEEDKQ